MSDNAASNAQPFDFDIPAGWREVTPAEYWQARVADRVGYFIEENYKARHYFLHHKPHDWKPGDFGECKDDEVTPFLYAARAGERHAVVYPTGRKPHEYEYDTWRDMNDCYFTGREAPEGW